MATSKLNIDLNPEVMRRIADKQRKLIRDDALKGISQAPNGERFGHYRSPQYRKYKANYMNRFTDKAGSRGTKLKQYSGQSVVSNQTSYVNETLTGRMFKDMQITDAKKNECAIAYAPKDAGKVLGAEALGRMLVGLNKNNIEIIAKMVADEVGLKIDEWAKIPIIIEVGQ